MKRVKIIGIRESLKRSQREREIRSQNQMATGTDLRDNRSATTLPQLHSFTTLLELFLKRQTFTVHSHVFVRSNLRELLSSTYYFIPVDPIIIFTCKIICFIWIAPYKIVSFYRGKANISDDIMFRFS